MSEICDSTKILAGIDGGGTRTRLVLTRGDGTLAGFAAGGCCSFVELGIDQAGKVLRELWAAAWKQGNMPPRPADALFIGTGSILSPADAQTNCEIVLNAGLARPGRIEAANDACNALAGALCGRPGLLLIAGTGSVCQGRNAAGQTWRAGGWGHRLNDAGSAHALGLAAIVAATRAFDGRGPATGLSSLVSDGLALGDLREIYRKVHHEGVSRADIAALAAGVVAQAEGGDAVANNIIDDAAAGLVEMVAAAAQHLQLTEPRLALRGGLIEKSAFYRKRFLSRLAVVLPGCKIADDGFAPVFGAAMLAHQVLSGTPPGPEFVKNLRQAAAKMGDAA